MIEIKPKFYNSFLCPECKSEHPEVHSILVEGVHAMEDCKCRGCGLEFYHLLPVGLTVGFSLSYGKNNRKLYDEDSSWVSVGLPDYLLTVRNKKIHFDKIVNKVCRKVIILNALDFHYGHCFLKLVNVQYHLDRHSDFGIIVVAPKVFHWLIPEGCAEIWLADLDFSDLCYRQVAVHEFVSNELKRFDQVHLSKAYSHPDFTKIDISRFTRVAPFDLARFSTAPINITFVLREDRCWNESRGWFLLYRFLRKIKLKNTGNSLLAVRQNRLVKKTIRYIRKELPEVTINIVGLGRTGNFKGSAVDYRESEMCPEVEISWCNIYARSQVVIGVHGSNMLLPTAQSAACVEILPEDRLGNIAQDLAVRYSDRRQLFLYRLLPQYSRPGFVAKHVISMIKNYEIFNSSMCKNVYC